MLTEDGRVLTADQLHIIALEADRDLWRWRFEELVKRLEPNEHESEYIHPSCRAKCDLHAAALEVAVAEAKGEE